MKMKPQKSSPDFEVRSFVQAVVLVDDNPARASASQELTKLYKSYSRHLSDISQHETHVRPSYYNWLAGLFAEQIARVQRLQTDLVQKSFLLQRMRDLCIFDGFSRSHAFERAQEELEFTQQGDEDESTSGDDSEETIDESFFEELEREFVGSRRGRRSDDLNEPRSTENQAKHFYRKLAQALHPDLSGEQTELTRELWEETQVAYKKRDLDQLKLIWTLVSLQKDAVSREVRLFDLRAAVAHLKERIRVVKKEKKRLSQEDPSWGFQKKNKQEFAANIRSELDREENMLSNALEDIEEDLKVFSKSSGRKRKKSD